MVLLLAPAPDDNGNEEGDGAPGARSVGGYEFWNLGRPGHATSHCCAALVGSGAFAGSGPDHSQSGYWIESLLHDAGSAIGGVPGPSGKPPLMPFPSPNPYLVVRYGM